MLSKASIKYIQSLQHKKFRDQEGVFVAEGPKLVKELLGGRVFPCRALYALPGWLQQEAGIGNALLQITPEPVKDFELEKISGLTKSNQVLAVFQKKEPLAAPELKNKITLVLDDIQDPGNLGTIIRIADWFAVENVVCSLQTADMYNSKVVQSTMASLQRVNLIYTDIVPWLEKNKSIRMFAATLQGTPIAALSGLTEAIIVIGNESAGVSASVLELANEQITIPRFGTAESLNAAVATGLILYEARRG